mmetsp:Transcript_20474/g.45748  ORF Transcript_20474/g.45748 Transcript_20474/m.45748 type:complete len:373 (-) Transcript_20474:84-1202(-)|eukprot:CAMPEP_0173318720 /NCGR_PEP_ID=MMETSP1143-20121109/27820_1 /TAXON_ID=483371 /ORGANISM="non described non described, Strain CCMP2298" /LENGTH=372 /DNA_ID=CAMNT_0014262009 /DNA_START=51 /DNA_END=1172 /DNA_ORIENTATION=+
MRQSFAAGTSDRFTMQSSTASGSQMNMMYAQRLNRDVSDLFSHSFSCSSSTLSVHQMADCLHAPGCIVLQVSIFDGPYSGGRFTFSLNIPSAYPFRSVEVVANESIWHPNIDASSGKVALPIEWSPVLTLHSVALSVQLLLLEPSMENPLNLEAYSLFLTDCRAFEEHTQRCLRGSSGLAAGKHQAAIMALDDAPADSQDMSIDGQDDGRVYSPTTPQHTMITDGISNNGGKRGFVLETGRKSAVAHCSDGGTTGGYGSHIGVDSRPYSVISAAAPDQRRKRQLEDTSLVHQSSHVDYEHSRFSVAAMKGAGVEGVEWENTGLLRSAASNSFAAGSFPTRPDGVIVQENSEADLTRATNAFKRLRTDGAPFS